MIVLLDTHAVVWLATASEALGAQSRELIASAARDGVVACSAITFWEIAMLADKGRLDLASSPGKLRERLLQTGLEEISLSGDVAILSAGLGLHPDPADRFIAATAYAHDAMLITADERLLKWQHPLKRQDARC